MKDWKLAMVVGGFTLAGVVIGAQVFGAQPATAQDGPYRECFFARQESVDVDDEGVVATPDRSRMIRVPTGYTVVSGGGTDGSSRAYALFCRR